jgi:hypothetical protein
MTENVRLKPKQQLAIMELLKGSTFEEASSTAGVSDRTLRRWMQEPGFKQALSSGQSEMIGRAVRRLANLVDKSLDELETLLKVANLKPHERVQVIRTALNGFARIHEGAGLEDRLDEIERLLNDKS